MAVALAPVPQSVYEAASRFKVLRDLKEQLEQQIKDTNKNLDITEQELADLMIDLEISKFPHQTAEGTVTIYLSNKLYASCPATNRKELRSYLINEGQSQILVDTVDDKALTKYVKGLLEEFDNLPPELQECITVFEKPSVCIRKASKKEAI